MSCISRNKARSNWASVNGKGAWTGIALLLLLTLACAGQQSLGALTVKGTPVPFTVEGEVEHVWSFSGEADTSYKIAVASLETENSTENARIEIYVFPGTENYLGKDRISASTVRQDNIAWVTFEFPNDDNEVQIVVASLVAETGTSLGMFNIEIESITGD